WVNPIIVFYIVSVILIRRGLERGQPDSIHPQGMQIVETRRESFKIADTISVTIHEGFEVEAVYDGVFVPEIFYHLDLFTFQWNSEEPFDQLPYEEYNQGEENGCYKEDDGEQSLSRALMLTLVIVLTQKPYIALVVLEEDVE